MTQSLKLANSSFSPIRFYTEFDPYYYTVDNRPLQDLNNNQAQNAAAADAGRIANIIDSIQQSAINAGIVGFTDTLIGVTSSTPLPDIVRLSPGALLSKQVINVAINSVILKKATLPWVADVSTPAPATLGREVRYLIQVRHSEFGPSTTFPYYDPANTFADTSVTDGWLEIGVIAGAETDLGLSVAPSVTPGWTAIFEVLAVAGSSAVTVTQSGPLQRVNKVAVFEASQEETDAGVVSGKYVSPARLTSGFAVSLGASGYLKLPNWLGGVCLQWGSFTTTAGAVRTVNYPAQFTSSVYTMAFSTKKTTVAVTDNPVVTEWGEATTSSFKAFCKDTSNAAVAATITYLAIGK